MRGALSLSPRTSSAVSTRGLAAPAANSTYALPTAVGGEEQSVAPSSGAFRAAAELAP
jgi:hypothetical protein